MLHLTGLVSSARSPLVYRAEQKRSAAPAGSSWTCSSESQQKLVPCREDFSLGNSEKLCDFRYRINQTIDAEAHPDDALLAQRKRGQELSGFVFRMTCMRQGRFFRPETPLHRSTYAVTASIAAKPPIDESVRVNFRFS